MFRFVFGAAMALLLCVPPAQAAEVSELEAQIKALQAYLTHVQADAKPLSSEAERAIIIAGADWMLAAQKGSGEFLYEYAPFSDEAVPGNAVVRQAGTLSALADVYKKQAVPDPKIKAALEAGFSYFTEETVVGGEDRGNEFWCVRRTSYSDRCPTGAVALTLVALLGYAQATPDLDREYQTMIEQYKNYLLAARLPGRGFSNEYEPDSGFSDEESPFYNGEALLALVRYYQHEPAKDVQHVVEEVFAYLRDKEYESPLYLWIMAALKDMQQLWPNDTHITYAHDFTAARLVAASLRRNTTHNYCAPLEGLVSAYSVLEGEVEAPFLTRLYDEIEFWLQHTVRLQLVAETPYRLNWVDGQARLQKVPNPRVAHGGFLTSEAVLTQRIDFTQHCVSAYLQKLTDIDGVAL